MKDWIIDHIVGIAVSVMILSIFGILTSDNRLMYSSAWKPMQLAIEVYEAYDKSLDKVGIISWILFAPSFIITAIGVFGKCKK